jgi:hypothetical protein
MVKSTLFGPYSVSADKSSVMITAPPAGTTDEFDGCGTAVGFKKLSGTVAGYSEATCYIDLAESSSFTAGLLKLPTIGCEKSIVDYTFGVDFDGDLTTTDDVHELLFPRAPAGLLF